MASVSMNFDYAVVFEERRASNNFPDVSLVKNQFDSGTSESEAVGDKPVTASGESNDNEWRKR